jgi:hypothetical protein
MEPVLADRAADGTGEEGGLQRRDAYPAVPVGAPGLLVGLDPERQPVAADLVAGGRALARAPVGQVVRQPATPVEGVAGECVLELELEVDGRSLPQLALKALRPRLARSTTLRRGEEVLERNVEEGAVRLGQQLVAVTELGRDLDPAASFGRHTRGHVERPVDRRRLAIADRDPRRHGREAVPGREQAARLVEGRPDDAAVRDPGTALVMDAERDLGRVGVGALRDRKRQPQPQLVVAAAEARRIVMRRD